MTARTSAPAASALAPAEELLWRRFAAVLATVPGHIDERLRTVTGLNHFQYSVLEALSREPEHRLQLAEIARAQDTSLSRLSHSMTRLESTGYVTRVTCDHDRRASWAVLTASGQDLVESSRDAYVQIIRETLLDRLGGQDHAALTDALTAVLPAEVARQCTSFDADLTD